MAQIPERVKHRKMHRGSRAGTARRGHTVAFGEYGLQAMGRCWLSTRQIEAARQTITRTMKRRGKLWIRVFPQKSYTKKPLEVRMGKGKANVEGWVAVVRPANVLFEVGGVTETLARECMRLAAAKLPIRTRFVARQHHA
ncbi:MAG: 50S ribosomal protein L16 [Verrucomicrobiota bacterium]|nr:50S ribosomal protein L16 [Verrucomicrobiota bacterium]|tara:strand:- start:423 stop:842 length:420 start_codon:yes stop_codon:yes gene_type:complete